MSDSRSVILDRIRQGLTQAYLPAVPAETPAPPPPPSFAEPLAEVFTRAAAAVHCRVERVASAAAARDWLLAEFATRGVQQVLGWAPAQLDLPGLAEGMAAQGVTWVVSRLEAPARGEALAALASIEVGLTGAQAGLARTGSLVLHADRDHGRLASLLPPVHYAVLRHSQLYPDLAAWIAAAGWRIAASSNTVIITGPSRSADIAQTLTLGAHGPREVHVVLIAA